MSKQRKKRSRTTSSPGSRSPDYRLRGRKLPRLPLNGGKGMTQNSLPDSTEEAVRAALSQVRCCYPESVTELGLIRNVSISGRGARIQVLPCCVFGLTRLVASVQHGVAAIDGIDRVEVDVAWD